MCFGVNLVLMEFIKSFRADGRDKKKFSPYDVCLYILESLVNIIPLRS